MSVRIQYLLLGSLTPKLLFVLDSVCCHIMQNTGGGGLDVAMKGAPLWIFPPVDPRIICCSR